MKEGKELNEKMARLRGIPAKEAAESLRRIGMALNKGLMTPNEKRAAQDPALPPIPDEPTP